MKLDQQVTGTLAAFDVDLPDMKVTGTGGLVWEIPAGRYELRPKRGAANPQEHELILGDGTPLTVLVTIGADGRVEIS